MWNMALVFHFDDFFGFPDWRTGGFKALQEISEKRRWRLTYLSYGTKEAAFLAERTPLIAATSGARDMKAGAR